MGNSALPYPIPLGQILLTAGAVAVLEAAGQTLEQLLAWHGFGDWEQLGVDDWKRNDAALQEGMAASVLLPPA